MYIYALYVYVKDTDHHHENSDSGLCIYIYIYIHIFTAFYVLYFSYDISICVFHLYGDIQAIDRIQLNTLGHRNNPNQIG